MIPRLPGLMPSLIAILLLFHSVRGLADDQENLREMLDLRQPAASIFMRGHPPKQWMLDYALYIVTREDDLARVKFFLDAGANADSHGYGPHDPFPLDIAAYNGNAEMVRLLLKRGANPNRKDVYGWTALFTASSHEHFEALDVLLQWKGCRHCLRDNRGRTALHNAVNWGSPKGVEYLLKHSRVRKNVKDDDGATALFLARERLRLAQPDEEAKWRQIIKLLKEG